MSRFFFDDEENGCFLEEFGVSVSFVDPSGSLRGTINDPVFAVVDEGTTLERDDLGATIFVGPVLLTMKTVEAKQLRTDTEIALKVEDDIEEVYRITGTGVQTDDGSLTIVPVERVR